MGNSFIGNLQKNTNFERTANGALAHKSTLDMVYDMFATGAAYRRRTDEDCILLFKKAYSQNPLVALKCLFYLRDCRGGQGERRFFRLCFKWLVENDPTVASLNLMNLPVFGRWDDLIYTTIGTSLEKVMLAQIKAQLTTDVQSKTPSLLAKWLPSENASAYTTKRTATKIRKYMGLTSKEYRKILSGLREKIKIVERLMSQNRWDEIEFDKIPSKAGLIYRNAFARRDILAKKYEKFIKSGSTKVNAETLYPYDIVSKVVNQLSYEYLGWGRGYGTSFKGSEIDRAAINKYWDCLPDYLNGADCKMLAVIDTSGSMVGRSADSPMNVALSLGMYCAERLGGDYHNKFVTFSQNPQFIEFEGVDFVDKVSRVVGRNECANTNLLKTFSLLRETAKNSRPEDRPTTIVVISDMQIDRGSNFRWDSNVRTEMETERLRWVAEGLEMPQLVYWNVNASGAAFLDDGPNVTYVSGASPSIFKQVLTGKTGTALMMDTLNNERYDCVKIA